MKYKVGDKVRVKSKTWYQANTNGKGYIDTNPSFVPSMSEHCGKIATITHVDDEGDYHIDIDPNDYFWSDEMFEETLYLPGDRVKMKSREWFEENKDESGLIANEYAYIDDKVAEDILDKVVTIMAPATPGYLINKDGYRIFDDWIEDLAATSEDMIGSDLEIVGSIIPGSPVAVCDKYHEDGPREDWTFATYVGARAKGINTKYNIWSYCIPLSIFVAYYQSDWKKCMENIYTGKDKQLIKINER